MLRLKWLSFWCGSFQPLPPFQAWQRQAQPSTVAVSECFRTCRSPSIHHPPLWMTLFTTCLRGQTPSLAYKIASRVLIAESFESTLLVSSGDYFFKLVVCHFTSQQIREVNSMRRIRETHSKVNVLVPLEGVSFRANEAESRHRIADWRRRISRTYVVLVVLVISGGDRVISRGGSFSTKIKAMHFENLKQSCSMPSLFQKGTRFGGPCPRSWHQNFRIL